MTQPNEINDDQPVQTELTFDEEIAQMVGASDQRTADALAQDGFELEPDVDPNAEVDGDPEPTPEPTPEPASDPVPDQVAALQNENARLVREAAARDERAAQQALEAQLQRQADDYATALIGQGWDDAQARTHAESERKRVLAEDNANRQADALFKSNLAQELSLSHGVPMATLMGAKTESEMRTLAVTNIKTPREIALETENAALKKAQVPSQPYSAPAARVAASSEQRNLDLYNQGVRTPEAEAAGKRAAGF